MRSPTKGPWSGWYRKPYGLGKAKPNTGPVPESNIEEYLELMYWVRWHTRRARVNWERGLVAGSRSQEQWAISRRRQAQGLRSSEV